MAPARFVVRSRPHHLFGNRGVIPRSKPSQYTFYRGVVGKPSPYTRRRNSKNADPVVGEDAGGLVAQFDRDIQNRVAWIAEVTETAEDLGRNQQSLRGAKLRIVQVPINAHDSNARLHSEIEGARISVGLIEEILHRY